VHAADSGGGAETVSDVAFIVCMTVLAILTAGDPDLIDAIISWVRECR
jgi:hypothetical protein